MDVHIEKVELAKRLLETDDEAVLLQIKEVFENNDKDFLARFTGTCKVRY